MKIGHVITRMIVGGAQENTLLSVRGHLEHGHDCTLITGYTTGPEGKLLDEIHVPNLRVIQDPHLKREIDLTNDLLAYFSLKKTFNAENFDVIHTHSSKAGVIARIAAKHAEVPVIVHTVHGPSFHKYQSYWKNLIYIWAERFAAQYSVKTYTVADAMSQVYLEKGIGHKNDYKTIYSGMDLSPFLKCKADINLATALGLDLNRPVIGKIARLFELKGYDYLLQAAPIVVKEIPDVQFLILGDGILGDSIKSQICEMGLQENFIFAGLVDPKVIHNYIALMDIVVHLSVREGLPRSVVQALACGKPAIGFNLDGTPEVIRDNKTGFLCQPGDYQQVGNAIIKILNDPQEIPRMGKIGREFVRERWDWKNMVTLLEDEYALLLSQS